MGGQSDEVDGSEGQQTADTIGGSSSGQVVGSESGSNGGQMDEASDVSDEPTDEVDDGSSSSSNEQQIDKAVTDANENSSSTVQSSKLSAAGATVMALGLVALVTLALLFMIVAKRRRSESYNEFDDDDEQDLHDKRTDVDAASLASSPNATKRAYVVGDEGSIYTSATHDTRYLHNSYESGNDNDNHLQVNVHHCTSALCPICTGQGPTFVNAMDSESTTGGVGRVLEPRQDRSFEYEVGEEVSTPSFRNPAAEMLERPYIVDDTVAF
jgi:hypothetical protein